LLRSFGVDELPQGGPNDESFAPSQQSPALSAKLIFMSRREERQCRLSPKK